MSRRSDETTDDPGRSGSTSPSDGGPVPQSPAADDAGHESLVVCQGLVKHFGSTKALDGVDLELRAGRIHGLVGQNGAGKSTLLGLLTGRIRPTAGSIRMGGVAWDQGGVSLRQASESGIAAVYQELSLVPALDAVDNVFLGRERHRLAVLRRKEMIDRFHELEEQLEVRIPIDVPVGRLSIAQQQLIEIMRGLNADAKVLLLDEPTAALPEHERHVVLETMRRLRRRGLALALITHALDEALEVCDTVTVLRTGRTVDSGPASAWDKKSLVHAMSGKYEEFQPELGGRADVPPFVEVEGLDLPGVLSGVDLQLRPGEIVGLAGLVGAGRTSIMRCLAGAERQATGSLRIDGERVSWPRTVAAALRRGITLLPEDRKSQGLHLSSSILDNIATMDLGEVSLWGVMRRSSEQGALEAVAPRVSLPAYDPDMPVRRLSGGNQQKVLLGKVLHSRPRLLLADEPTRGVDIAAKVDIARSLRALADEGMAILMTSAEIEDVLTIADSVLVVAEGRIVARLDMRERSVAVEDILKLVFEATDSVADPTSEGDVA